MESLGFTSGRNAAYMFEYQPPATLDQAAPVQNTFYDLLTATDYVRVYGVAVNVEDTDETLQVQATVDGEVWGAANITATHSTNYFIYRNINAIVQSDGLKGTVLTAVEMMDQNAYLLEGHNVTIQVRKTTAAGVGNLTGVAIYGVLTRAFID